MDIRPGMAISLHLDRIPPGAQIGPRLPGQEAVVYVAAGEIVFEHGPGFSRHVVVRSGDVLYEAPADEGVVRNDGAIDALALRAAIDVDPARPIDDLPSWRMQPGEPVRRREGARVMATSGMHHRVLAEVRPARVLRRDGQPRRALPDSAPPRLGPRRMGGQGEGDAGRGARRGRRRRL